MASKTITTIIKQCQIAPTGTRDELTEFSLPLNFLDMPWLPFHPLQRLLFYEFTSCSSTYFFETIIPSMESSLSLALGHFLPLSGNLIVPPTDNENTSIPKIRFVPGDTVSLTLAESKNLNYFIHRFHDHPRYAHEFYPFAPSLPKVTRSCTHVTKVPLLALQVTLFPNEGICIGFANHHVAGDASTIIGFMRTWASIHKLGGGNIAHDLVPVLDRSVVKYPCELDSIYWNEIIKNVTKVENFDESAAEVLIPPLDRVRANFVISQEKIKILKDLVISRLPRLVHVSSFTVTCAFVWTCLVKSRLMADREGTTDDDDEYFMCPVDCRGRLDPPLPATYFGNCLAPCIVELRRTELAGGSNEGFFKAAEAIGEGINKMVTNENGIFGDADAWLSKLEVVMRKPGSVLGVSGSPKFDVYDTDFGWGIPKMFENLSTSNGSMSLSKWRGLGGLEVGLSLPITQMDSLEIIFLGGLIS
ncbi:hypothetical protein Leryth_012925 [Lithospermum erythrorhizon]|nr:hypothetical protein Leryth_012925 [Lithospermum erythrorhizon]